MIDPKYCSRLLSILTTEELVRETQTPKVKVTLEIFADDYQLAKEQNLNLSRILRFKLHDWLQDKLTEG